MSTTPGQIPCDWGLVKYSSVICNVDGDHAAMLGAGTWWICETTFWLHNGFAKTEYDWAMDDPGLAVEHFIFAGTSSCEVHLKWT